MTVHAINLLRPTSEYYHPGKTGAIKCDVYLCKTWPEKLRLYVYIEMEKKHKLIASAFIFFVVYQEQKSFGSNVGGSSFSFLVNSLKFGFFIEKIVFSLLDTCIQHRRLTTMVKTSSVSPIRLVAQRRPRKSLLLNNRFTAWTKSNTNEQNYMLT